jgi:ParB family chromosome partitioning protein
LRPAWCQKKIQTAVSDGGEHGGDQAAVHVVTRSIPDAAEGISVPLLKKMSSERTLAVQAELVKQPQKAVALMVWRLCSACLTTAPPPGIRLSCALRCITAA